MVVLARDPRTLEAGAGGSLKPVVPTEASLGHMVTSCVKKNQTGITGCGGTRLQAPHLSPPGGMVRSPSGLTRRTPDLGLC